MEFNLFSKLASLEGIELYMLLGALVVLAVLVWAIVSYTKRAKVQAALMDEYSVKVFTADNVYLYDAMKHRWSVKERQ